MDIGKLRTFLGEESLIRHEDYLNTERSRHSIREKCFPKIKDCTYSQIYSMRGLSAGDRSEILDGLSSILFHELYFSSFTDEPRPSETVRNFYGSEDKFLYEAWLYGREHSDGFLYVFCDRRGVPRIAHTSEGRMPFLRVEPLLAIDLCEHAYFLDYGFQRSEYLRRALGFLNIASLDAKS